ncbi:PhzF family phenazine biosynthesis protein [Kitasatospora sp. CB01950]|uniref:PhzF family phenazine biosynthesis protein n=1 Tax=Kitasatospora sp. CB01950 TaxID=1703930 RepID=UPI00093B8173|nr:PhzF family phenazine biosynthesis isomerase [Kitasatospora sp. CB01950]OKJ05232.1 phenazine biosynthesis protein PhzF [Kitasatospora sp. CB01950]
MTDNTPADPAEPLRYAAFTADPAGGNPAGVVLDATALGDRQQLALAAELGYSETAFLTPVPDQPRSRTVRYFSPRLEVPFCGHATIAAAVALGELIGPGELLFETKAGPVPVAVERTAGGEFTATLTSVPPYVEEADAADLAEALDALGWKAGELDPQLPPMIAYAGARHLVIGAATRARLADLDYDFEALAALMRRLDLVTLQLVWEQDAATFHVRDPFPVGGIVEDPATGAAAAAFGAYLRHLRHLETARLTLHQGEDLGRPGLLTVDLTEGEVRVRVTGRAVRIP